MEVTPLEMSCVGSSLLIKGQFQNSMYKFLPLAYLPKTVSLNPTIPCFEILITLLAYLSKYFLLIFVN